MSSSEKAQELICEYMPDIRYGCPYGFMYEWDDVFDKWINRINNALFEYADGMHPSEVLAIIDLSFWENGKKGYILTCDGFVSSDMKKYGIDFIEYSDIKELSYAKPAKSKDNDRGLWVVTKSDMVYQKGLSREN